MQNSKYLILSLVLSVTACGNDFLIKTKKVGSTTELAFYEPGFLWSTRITPCLQSLKMYRGLTNPPVDWRIEASDKGCVKIDRVLVGQVPPGFRQVGSYTPPKPGIDYSVWAKDNRDRYGGSAPWRL